MTEQDIPKPEESLQEPLENELNAEKEMLASGQEKLEENAVDEKSSGWESEKKELQDKYLRLAAEFDNFRRRTIKEKTEWMQTAGQDILVSVLPILDDLERALKNFPDDSNFADTKMGIELIHQKMTTILVSKGLKPIEALGTDFNTDLHEAITHIPASEESLKGKVVDEVERGYMLGEKVIRFSKVVIGS